MRECKGAAGDRFDWERIHCTDHWRRDEERCATSFKTIVEIDLQRGEE